MAARRTGRPGPAAWAVLSLALLPWCVQAQSLASIPVDPGPLRALSPQAQDGLRARVHVLDAQGLSSLLGHAVGTDKAATSLDLTLLPGAHLEVASPADPLAASFIVDFDDPAVARLSQQLRGEHGPGPIGGERIVAFVAKSMRTTEAVSASLASEVARTLQGDCTEHALLTAALARSLRIPARLVQGAALVFADGQWQAYGHAWVQTHEAGRWRVRDSALAGWSGPVYYLPAFVIGDEGPGFKLDMMRSFGRMPSRIEILGPVGTPLAR